MAFRLCYGCKHLLEEPDPCYPTILVYRCRHFPRKVILAVYCPETEPDCEEEEPWSVTRNCYTPLKPRKIWY